VHPPKVLEGQPAESIRAVPIEEIDMISIAQEIIYRNYLPQ